MTFIEIGLLVIYGVWTIRIVGNIMSFIHLWYVKEYRYDRMKIHFHTPQGKRLYLLPWRIPPKSPKTILLFILTGAFAFTVGIFLSVPMIFRYLIIDLFTFPITWILVGLLSIPTRLYHHSVISSAIKKIRSHKKMKVIGITGSYGKTSTKEYVATILATKYTVLKTSASKNSPIAIAETIHADLTDKTEVFVVEMGAYKPGEIAEMCRMVRPEIGVITAINEQHQDLFGTIERTMKAKYELIAGLNRGGIGIFNADNEKVRQMAQWAKSDDIPVRTYSVDRPVDETTVWASNIRASGADVRFIAHHKKQAVEVCTSVIGSYQVSNILAAIQIAMHVGFTLDEAASGARLIRAVDKVMQAVPGVNGSIFVNDTFNNNPDAAVAALDYLATTKGRKFFVFQPMIELGSFAESAHRRVGQHAARVADEIILTNSNFMPFFVQGVHAQNPNRSVRVLSVSEGSEFLKKHVSRKDTVLFKGKEAEFYLKAITKGPNS